MKYYLFLDIDGVLHHLGSTIYHRSLNLTDHHKSLSLESKALLLRILKKHKIEVIISSTWRKTHSADEIKKALGDDIYSCVVGNTPILNKPRGEEIKLWLNTHRKNWTPNQVLILDDDSDMGSLLGCLFKTDAHSGFNGRDFVNLLNYIESPYKKYIRLCKKIKFNFSRAYWKTRYKLFGLKI